MDDIKETLSKLNGNQLENIDVSKLIEGLSEKEKTYVLNILEEISKDKSYKLYNEVKYRQDFQEIPVDITTFMHDMRYLGKALYNEKGEFTVFPYWEKVLQDIFPTNITTRYNTVILTGSIGIGKSTIADIILLYQLYRLLCLRDPYLYYGLQSIDKLTISFMNITIDNAKGVALDKLNNMILLSEWFMSHGEMRGTSNLEYVPNKRIELVAASSNNQVVGRCLFANFSDEVNFSITSDIEKAKDRYLKLITQIDARMKSRFMRTLSDGSPYLPTINIIASSKNTEQSFLDCYINEKIKNNSKTTLIVQEPQWVVDRRKDSPIKFWVAIGNSYLPNELLPQDASEELVQDYRLKGYDMWAVPIGYWETFCDNLDEAICSIIGIATASATKYISGQRFKEIKNTNYQNPFVRDIIEVGTAPNDIAQYKDFFDLSRVPSKTFSLPMFIHLDLSKSGDMTGIAGVVISSKENAVEGQKSLHFRLAFSVSVKAPKGYEISFEKTRAFILWLRDTGFNIRSISMDTFQSAQIQQQLLADGFEVKTLSVDRLTDLGEGKKDCLPYSFFKNAIYQRRLEVYSECKQLEKEVIGLEKEQDGHINHEDGGKKGSKDQCDAVCGATYNASFYSEEFCYNFGETFEDMIEVNNDVDFSTNLIEMLRNEAKSHFFDMNTSNGSAKINRENDDDDGFTPFGI